MLPVTWVDGWPIIGNDTDSDGIGEMVWGGRKPINGHPSTVLAAKSSSIQVAKLEIVDGVLLCDRDKEFELNLGAED